MLSQTSTSPASHAWKYVNAGEVACLLRHLDALVSQRAHLLALGEIWGLAIVADERDDPVGDHPRRAQLRACAHRMGARRHLERLAEAAISQGSKKQ